MIIRSWLVGGIERQRILVHQLPERAQISVPLSEQLIVEFLAWKTLPRNPVAET